MPAVTDSFDPEDTGDGTYPLTGSPTDWGEDPGADTLFIGASSTGSRVLLGTLSRPIAA